MPAGLVAGRVGSQLPRRTRPRRAPRRTRAGGDPAVETLTLQPSPDHVTFLLDAVLEALLMLIFAGAWELVMVGTRAGPKQSASYTRAVGSVTFGILGLINGWFSVMLVPNRLFSTAPPDGLSLILAPCLAGLTLRLAGRAWPGRAATPMSLLRFWTGFDFAFGMALIRFVHASGWTS